MFAVGVVVRVVLCICWVAGVGGRSRVVLQVPGTLLLVLGGGCRRSVVVVVVGCGVGRLLASSSLLDHRGTGRRLESFLEMTVVLWEMCRSVSCCDCSLSAAAGTEAVHLILMEEACECEKNARTG